MADNGKAYRLVLEGLGKRFGPRVICHDVSWELVGPNGSGKSTLLKLIAGLLRSDHGTVRHVVSGRDAPGGKWYRHIGLVSPELTLYEELTALEILRLADRLGRLGTSSPEHHQILEEFGLDGRGYDLVQTYSSGMKQRLKYCAACLKQPLLLLLDEPTANLDGEGVERVWQALERRKPTLIIATNEENEANRATRQFRVGADGGWVRP